MLRQAQALSTMGLDDEVDTLRRIAAIAALTAFVGCSGVEEAPPAETTVRPVATVGPQDPLAEPEPPPPEPTEDPKLGAMAKLTARAASHALEISRRYAAPRTWGCSSTQRKDLARSHKHTRMKRESDALAATHWDGMAGLQERVPNDVTYWKRIRWAYMLRGICDPEAFVIDGIVPTRFLDRPLRVHVEIAPLLSRIERALEGSEGGVPEFTSISAFYPRTVRGPFRASKKLSNHAFGKAIDIDPRLNPYLSRRELKTIEAIGGVKIKRSTALSAADRWDNFKKAETAFLEKVGPWLDTRQSKLDAARKKRRGRATQRTIKRLEDELALVEGSKNLSRALESGFLSLPRHFVVQMEASGLTWATDFGPGADLMHFELRR